MRIPVTILDKRTAEPVQADLFDEVTMDHFLETQSDWRPLVVTAARRLKQRGAPTEDFPHHWHWDWTTKEPELRLLAVTFYGVECRGRLQGLMKVETIAHRCRLPEQSGKPLVYVDYLEVAPRNLSQIMEPLDQQPDFGGVGSRLVEAAVRLSQEEGFQGRLGLHSLPTSEAFYLQSCGMTAGAPDPDKENLLWCEFTPEGARRFLAGGNR